MATPEIRKGALPPERVRTSARPKPDVITAPVTTEPRKPQKTKRPFIQRLVSNFALRLFLAGTASAGIGYTIYQQVPSIHRTIDQQVLGRISLTEAPISSAFDSASNNGVIGDNNVLDVSLKTIQDIPTLDTDGNLLLYITPPQPGKSISYEVTTKTVKIAPGKDYDEANAVAMLITNWIEDIKANDAVPMPYDGYAQEYTDEKGNFLSIWIYFTDAKGKQRRLNITPQDTRTTLMQDLPKITPSNYATGDRTSLKRGVPLFKANADMQIAYSNSIEATDGAPSTFKFKPLTVPDQSGNAKIPRAQNETISP